MLIGTEWHIAYFNYEVGPSRVGEFSALHLDYDHPDNGPLLQVVRDELREVAPDLWLGLSYVDIGFGEQLAFTFALERE